MPGSGNQGLTEALRPSEWKAIIEAAESDRDRMIAFLVVHTGCRAGELVTLRARDILVEDRCIRLDNLKRRRGQHAVKLVAVNPHVLDACLSYVRAGGIGPQDWLFRGRSGAQHLSKRQAQRIWGDLAAAAGVYRTSLRTGKWVPAWLHTARHGYATHLINSGVDLATIQKQLGHSQIANTVRYAELSTVSRSKAIEGVDI
jgi:integrase